MGYNKEAKYVTGLKPVNGEFTYKIGDEGEYYVDHANGYDRVNDVIDALTNAINTYNTTREDIRGMIKGYVLEEEVSLNQLLDYLTGGMSEALQTVSDKTKEVLEEMITKLQAAEATNKELEEEQDAATKTIDEDTDKTNKHIVPGEERPKSEGLSQEELKEKNDDLFDDLNGKDYSGKNGGEGQCGMLARNMLENMGLIKKDIVKSNGKNYAKTLANSKDGLTDGHVAIGHDSNQKTQQDVFDKILSDNGGSTGALVFSFDSTGHYRNSGVNGHVVVVSGISDGKVYLVDNYTENWKKGTTTVEMSIDDFKQHYLGEGNTVNYITEVI